ncbi:MAG: metal ABC transporter permease [Deltaproteobacteria bacterium]|nr:metal ABC transporter permease [Candidatus Anaeroferrophillus wilburensis]MBN2888314.1 metal ABC transporter permease [Deltaproteobacteria bacterium]
MPQILSVDFFQNALLAALLVSVTCGVIGTLVVVNRLVFLAGGIAHAAFGGVGVAYYFGLPPLPCTALFSVIAALAMGGISMISKSRPDTIIGAMWAIGMAVGIILVDLTPGYHADLFGYLFGSILAVSTIDLVYIIVIDLLVLMIVYRYHHELLAISYDPEYAEVCGLPVRVIQGAMLVLVALSIVVLIRVVGLILIIALLTIPAAIAEELTPSIRNMMLLAVGISIGCIVGGLLLSFLFDLTSGATIILLTAVVYLLFTACRCCFSR